MEELINQNPEGYLIIFIIGGALAILVYMFIQSPKKFLKWLFKDIVEQFLNSSKQKEEKEEKEQEEKRDDNIELDELRKNCTGYDEEGWPKTASPHAIHHKECDGCKRECPLMAKNIKLEGLDESQRN